ncbi:MAG TPA: hypothetical protein VF727_01370 [Allosphingosinicella sp.]
MNQERIPPLLAEALDAHGGLERWRSSKGLSSTIVTTGVLWALKGAEVPPEPRTVTTDFHRQWAGFTPFLDPASTMTWTPDRVAIQQASDLVGERFDPRAAFAGHGLETPWDALHLAYFQGYAMWTYHALPFLLAQPGFEVREIEPVVEEGVTLRGLAANFPEAVHTHSRDQRFYFDPAGLLRRHDYQVDVSGGTRAAHYLSGNVEADGFKFPTRREVYQREEDGSVSREHLIVGIELSDYRLR